MKIHIGILYLLIGFMIYTYVDDKYYSENNSVKKISVEQKRYAGLKIKFKWLDEATYGIIKTECEKRSIDPALFMSLIQYESGDYCNNNLQKMLKVHSKSNAIGLCQLLARYHAPNGNIKALYDPKINIKLGAQYFSLCMNKAKKLYGRNWIKEAARMYNQGANGKRWRYKNWAYTNRIYRKYQLAVINGN